MLISILAAPVLALPAQDPDALPQPIRAMLEAAMESGNETDVAVVARYAKASAPDSAEAIEAMVSGWRTERRAAREQEIRTAGMFDLVQGRAEVGGVVTSGNTDTVGLAAVLDLRREGLEWRHKVHAQADYQETSDVTNRERFLAAYEPNYKFSERGYVFGTAQFESDRFAGFDQRYTFAVGLGYTPLKTASMTLELEAGPAFRRTNFTAGGTENAFAARGSLDFQWKLSDSVTFLQVASAYYQAENSTLQSKTGLRAKLFGPLSAQLSYQVQYESDPPAGRETTDTTGRASLVVDF